MDAQKIVAIVLSCIGIVFLILYGILTYSAVPDSFYFFYIGIIFVFIGVIVGILKKPENWKEFSRIIQI